MTIREATSHIVGSNPGVHVYKPCQALDIGFVNRNGKDDETQLDVTHSIMTIDGVKELEELWESLADELDAEEDSVTYIYVVAAADTYDELEMVC